MPVYSQQGDSFPDAKPVPKEGDLKVPQSYSKSGNVIAKEELAGPSPAKQEINSTFNNSAQEVGSQMQGIETQKKTQEKSKKNRVIKTCCLASCIGCLIIVLLVVIAFIFAAPMISNMITNILYPNISVPEVEEVDTEILNQSLLEIETISEEQTLSIPENEVNVILSNLLKDNPDGVDIRIDFEEDMATVFIKVVDWMPWILLNASNTPNGEVVTEDAYIGTLKVDKNELEGYDFGTETFPVEGVDGFISALIFMDESPNIVVKEMYFKKDQVVIVIEPILDETSEESVPL